jgi:lysyl-tRNA synthetase class 2
LEVETPLLSQAGVTDLHIPSFTTLPGQAGESPRYLATSPEFAMKRLLAAGSGPIYQVCKAFRQGEQGRLHNPEFTLLEWYRPGFDHHRLMEDVAALITALATGFRPLGEMEKLSYGESFQRYLGIDPHNAQGGQLKACAQAQGLAPVVGLTDDDRDGWLDLLMSHCIQPQLGRGRLTFLYDYPASQAALAQVNPGPPPVAARFEVFVDGVELANGFHELQDASEQRARFHAECVRREQANMEPVVVDERLLSALAAGLPDCAGVALGLDRLQLVLTGVASLQQVLAFPFDRA